jgi:acid stress-induced BolA-like protein IbaG/YrbA
MSFSHDHSHPAGSVSDEIRAAIEAAIPGAMVIVQGGGGHYTISVTAKAFEGKNMLQSQRMVLGAIAHLMKGDAAPVHAVDKLETHVD